MAHLKRCLLEGYCYHVISVTRDRHPALRAPRNAKVVADALQFVRNRAFVLAFVVMPDHFHALVSPRAGESLSKIMQSVKGYSARVVNATGSRAASVWQQSYYDRVIRDEPQLWETIEYIHRNPVKAGLVASVGEYPFSSAFPGVTTDLGEFLGS